MPCPTSPRLRFDELDPDDADFILRLTNSEGWLRYIGDRGVRSREDAIRYIEDGPRRLYRECGYGLWRISRIDDRTPMGLCGLVRRDSLPGPDLGFAFLPEFWGAGYAREAAQASLDFAREQLRLPSLLAICQTDNAASLKLLEAIGFTRVEPFTQEDGHQLWRLEVAWTRADATDREVVGTAAAALDR
ncbi:GNAT family N-acetyltransferase [Aquimonas voraii]|uniref:Protein N-acetyltransferase, RimJ/RimL family n=1 Tax=Aquimonas voraii TaxID=265719 RepID=A0A1G6UZ68_9GAMM|nr:GNAT family N-acetyltransferase [Aquimonas voraii]SDD45926.1 Protein N-acetyltransferase, RimJ/RimL family [Aquimonas voraii]